MNLQQNPWPPFPAFIWLLTWQKWCLLYWQRPRVDCRMGRQTAEDQWSGRGVGCCRHRETIEDKLTFSLFSHLPSSCSKHGGGLFSTAIGSFKAKVGKMIYPKVVIFRNDIFFKNPTAVASFWKIVSWPKYFFPNEDKVLLWLRVFSSPFMNNLSPPTGLHSRLLPAQ